MYTQCTHRVHCIYKLPSTYVHYWRYRFILTQLQMDKWCLDEVPGYLPRSWTSLYTQYILYHVQCTLFNVQYIQYNVHSTMYTLLYTLYTVSCTLYTVRLLRNTLNCFYTSIVTTWYRVIL